MIEEKLRKQLRRAMILVFLVIAVFVVFGILFSAYLSRMRNETIRSQVVVETEEYRTRILKQLGADFQTLSSLASFLDAENIADRQLLARRIDASNQNNPFLTIVFFDTKGRGVISTMGREPSADISLSILSEEGRKVVESALKGEPAISKMFESEVSDSRVFAYAVPVYNEDEVIGALAASDHIEIFSDIISGNTVLGGGGYIHLVSMDGRFLVRSSKMVVQEDISSIFDGPYLKEGEKERVREAMAREERVGSTFQYEGRSYPFLLEPVGVNGWYLFCVNTGEGLASDSGDSVWVTQMVLAGILLLIIFLMLHGYRLLRNYNQSLTKLAYFDPLTGSENLNRFRQRMESALSGSGGAVVEFAIRQFSFLTEIFGKEKTEHLLCQIKETVEEELREEEFFCHHTEDRFYFFLRDTREDVIRLRLEELLEKIGRNADIGQTDYQLAFYCGVALRQDKAEGNPERAADILMTHVHFALERAKGAHTNFIWFFDSELHKREELENYIESHMNQALLDGEFKMFLQPKKNLHTGKLEGAEALVRWQPGDGRTLYPDQFIPLFERNGFCVELDLYMVRQACRLLRAWMDQGIEPIPISVNQSKLLFFEPDYVQSLTALLSEFRVPARFIVLEILEGLALENVDELNEKISQLQAEGFRISLDDFGSGYSSMNTLSRLKINELKLDKGFLLQARDKEGRKRNCMILEQIVNMSRQLGIFTVTEGVETAEDEAFIRSVGCDVGQGYFYSRPISVEEFNAAYMDEPGKRSLSDGD